MNGLVDLFGKKKYEDRIRELESRVSDLSREMDDLTYQLEKKEEKIRKLTSVYQETNLALKAAEKKVSLVLKESPNGEPETTSNQRIQGYKIRPKEIQKLIDRLRVIRSPEDDLLTAYLKRPENLPSEAEELARSVKPDQGMVVLHCPQIFTLVMVPPFPVTEISPTSGSDFLLDQLQDFLDTPVLVISAHAGDTFLGLALTKNDFELQEIVESPVKEKHSKGGWSQKRFERLREEDIRNHADAVVQKLSELAGKYRSIARYAVVGGDPILLKMIMPELNLPVVERRLERHDSKRLDRLLDDVYSFTLYRS